MVTTTTLLYGHGLISLIIAEKYGQSSRTEKQPRTRQPPSLSLDNMDHSRARGLELARLSKERQNKSEA